MRTSSINHTLTRLRHRYQIQSRILTSITAYASRKQRADGIRNNYRAFVTKRNFQTKNPVTVATHNEPTIYALSTPPGRAAIAIIRLSGSACMTVYGALCPGRPLPKPRYAALRALYAPGKTSNQAHLLDSGALVLYFPGPETATGEDVLELHVHGGPAVVKAILASIPRALPKDSTQHIRYAEPGEFTRRAFYNNRLDLLQIEALGDTLSAETEQQRRLAVRGSTNNLAERYESWRQKLLYARGELEALIDFSEDQHFDESPAHLCASVAKQVRQLHLQLQRTIANASRGELLRSGINIALIGAPNAGKSSLLNQIVGREAAIVSSEPGTTRDIIDVNLDIGGYYCRFGDLAGIRTGSQLPSNQSIGEIEMEGMRRAKQRALTADVVITVLPAFRTGKPSSSEVKVDVGSEVLHVLEQCDPERQKILCVVNKRDLFSNLKDMSNQCQISRQHPVLRKYMDQSDSQIYSVSCRDAESFPADVLDPGGIQTFLEGLIQLFGRMTTAIAAEDQKALEAGTLGAESLGTTERQRILLDQCLEHLETFLFIVGQGKEVESAKDEEEEIDIVLAAESLRSAAECLAKVTGKGEAGDVEEVLGVVFEKYIFNYPCWTMKG